MTKYFLHRPYPVPATEEARAQAYPVLVEGEQRTLLAGEHMSYLGGWQAGAIESAWQQMERIHQRLSTQGAAA